MTSDTHTDDTPDDIDRRLARVPIVSEFAENLFTGDFAVVDRLPDDARLVRTYDDPLRNAFNFVFKSRHFDPLDEGEEIPAIRLEVRNLNELETDD